MNQAWLGSVALTIVCMRLKKSLNTEKGPGTFYNCKLSNSTTINNLTNQYVLMNLKDIRQHVLGCSDEYINALFLGPQKTDHSLS